MESRDVHSIFRAVFGCVIPCNVVNESLPTAKDLQTRVHSCDRQAQLRSCRCLTPGTRFSEELWGRLQIGAHRAKRPCPLRYARSPKNEAKFKKIKRTSRKKGPFGAHVRAHQISNFNYCGEVGRHVLLRIRRCQRNRAAIGIRRFKVSGETWLSY